MAAGANDRIQRLEGMADDYDGPMYVEHAGVTSYQDAANRRRKRALSESSPLSTAERQELLDAYAQRDASIGKSRALYDESAFLLLLLRRAGCAAHAIETAS